ncbi:hypothetical protein CBM2614_B160116 [Cupriavidus taiwanensis]|nr:hypothetical protein CBM2614_B160116 [Cupriavidus taiwanensis]
MAFAPIAVFVQLPPSVAPGPATYAFASLPSMANVAAVPAIAVLTILPDVLFPFALLASDAATYVPVFSHQTLL